ncbi:MAG: DNA-directed RNA polymerase subunit omega [Zetaproteobacteria bacterium CG1_02_53_45]|nr:MAG: DNA-directed RNA polymerase subunit omega [Zetaproteobacteria bacterium CG1_02_53_45]
MARVTVEDCIRYYPNRFEMVLLASRRARQLLNGMPAVLETEGDKHAVQALREMGEGYVSWESLFEGDEQARLRASQFDEDEAGAA